MGGSTEITRANFGSTAGGENINGQSKAAIWSLLLEGFSLQNAIAILQSQMNWKDWKGNRGPRVPGFARGVTNFSGGEAWVGEEGPERVTLPRGVTVHDASTSALSSWANDLVANGIGKAARALTDHAEWDRLNAIQGAMFLEAGEQHTAAYRAIIDKMRPLTPAGFAVPDYLDDAGLAGPAARPRVEPAAREGHGGSGGVTVAPGAVVLNLHSPIMRDRQAMEELGAIAGDAITQRMLGTGWQPPLGARK